MQNIILLIAAGINLLMSILVFSRGIRNNKINLYFSLVVFFNVLWAVGLIILNAGINIELTRFFASLVYPIALVIIVLLLYFIVYFPYKMFDIPIAHKWLINIFVVAFSIWAIFFYKMFVPTVTLGKEPITYYEPYSYLLYSIFLILLMLAGICILFYKYKKAEAIYKKQIGLILIAVIIGSVAGVYFDLMNDFMRRYFNEVNYDYLGPLFTLLINFVVFYMIFLNKVKITEK